MRSKTSLTNILTRSMAGFSSASQQESPSLLRREPAADRVLKGGPRRSPFAPRPVLTKPLGQKPARGLQLTRPLVAFDLETTGLFQTLDRIIQFGAVRVEPDGTVGDVYCTYIYTDHPISQGAYKAHKISHDKLIEAKAPTFSELAPQLYKLFDGADLTGYNAQVFDKPFLRNEFARVGFAWPPPDALLVDSYRIFRSHVSLASAGDAHRLDSNAVPFYLGKKLENAHNAGADAAACLQVLMEQCRIHPIPKTIQGLHDLCHSKLHWAKEDDLLSPSLGQLSATRPTKRVRRRGAMAPTPQRTPGLAESCTHRAAKACVSS